MIEDSKTGRARSAEKRSKRAWSTPTLTRLEASGAELFTRETGDGEFSTS